MIIFRARAKCRPVVFGRPFVKRFAFALSHRCLSVCPVCLSVTFVHCGQTVGRIQMKLGMQVGFGPGHIVLDVDPAPPPPKGHSPQFSAHIGCGEMAAWIKMSLGIELGLGPGDFVLYGDPAPPSQKGAEPPIFGPCYLWPNGWMDQDAIWHEGRPQPRRLCVRWYPAPLLKKEAEPGGRAPNFRSMSIVAKRLDGSRWHLAWR